MVATGGLTILKFNPQLNLLNIETINVNILLGIVSELNVQVGRRLQRNRSCRKCPGSTGVCHKTQGMAFLWIKNLELGNSVEISRITGKSLQFRFCDRGGGVKVWGECYFSSSY